MSSSIESNISVAFSIYSNSSANVNVISHKMITTDSRNVFPFSFTMLYHITTMKQVSLGKRSNEKGEDNQEMFSTECLGFTNHGLSKMIILKEPSMGPRRPHFGGFWGIWTPRPPQRGLVHRSQFFPIEVYTLFSNRLNVNMKSTNTKNSSWIVMESLKYLQCHLQPCFCLSIVLLM